jgi:hypothetical protein
MNSEWPTYTVFLAVFSGFSFLVLLILANAVVVGSAYWRQKFASVWSVKLLHTLVAVLLEFFFVARLDFLPNTP